MRYVMATVAAWAAVGATAGFAQADDAIVRRPTALALTSDAKSLVVALRDAGAVARVDLASAKVQTTLVGERIVDLTPLPGGRFAAVDEAKGELLVLAPREGAFAVESRARAGTSPVCVRVGDDGRKLAVACLWARRLAIFDVAKPDRPAANVDLPFAPRHLLAVPGSAQMFVADAFGGKLAVVDLRSARVESVRELGIHNVGGLALDRSGKRLLVTHQMLHAQGRPSPGEIQSSSVVGNHLRRLALDTLLNPLADVGHGEQVFALGDVDRGAGDPAALAELADGRTLVCVAGSDEIHLGRPDDVLWERWTVGRRPTALAVDEPRGRAFVANRFSDSITEIDLTHGKPVREIPLGKTPTLTAAQRGEIAFHDAKRSFESWYSCHSCHVDGHTSGRLNDNLSDGSFGTPKRVLTLLGVGDTGPWAWNGKADDLAGQVRTSFKSTMQGPTPPDADVADVVAFLRTLKPPPSLPAARGDDDGHLRKRGAAVFERERCAACHKPGEYTHPKAFDVGVHDEKGGTHFNPPSLRGLSQAGPYFHDNRARTLDDVFRVHRHPGRTSLSDADLAALLAFLRSL